MKKLLILLLTFTMAGELEVEGDLKVQGKIDAQNNPVTNVGAPQSLTDAVNAGILQNALSDEGNYEYKIYMTRNYYEQYHLEIYWYEFISGVSAPSSSSSVWTSNFHNEMFSLLGSNWRIDQTINYNTPYSSQTQNKILYIFKRPIGDN